MSTTAKRVIITVAVAVLFRIELVILGVINKIEMSDIIRAIFLLIAWIIVGFTLCGLSIFWGRILKDRFRFVYRILCYFIPSFFILGMVVQIIHVFVVLC